MNNTENIMVCVTQQKTCERLIKKGNILKQKLDGDLYVIHVAKEGTGFLGNNKEADAIEYLYDISREVGADMTIIRSNDVVETLVKFATQKDIGHIVMGEAPSDYIIRTLEEKLSDKEFYIIPAKELE